MKKHKLYSTNLASGILLFAFTLAFFLISLPGKAQQGVIASCYYREKATLQKMWKAKKAGNNDELQRLSNELKAFYEEKQTWAKELLSLTESSIKQLREKQELPITPEDLANKLEEIRQIKGEIRVLQKYLESARLDFLRQNYANRFEIKENQKIIRINKELGKKEIADKCKGIEETQALIDAAISHARKEIEKLRESQTNAKDQEEKDSCSKQIEKISALLASGDYAAHPAGYTINQQKSWNENARKHIADVELRLKTGAYGRGYPIATYEDWIKHSQKVIDERKKQFTEEIWWNMGDTRKELQALKLKLLHLQEETGSTDEKMMVLQATKAELQSFIDHSFLTNLPEEESGILKAIKWCTKAIKKVMDVAENLKEVKAVLDIVKGTSNPAHAFDLIYRKATGKSLYLTIAKKAFPSWITKSGAFQEFLKTGTLDRKKVVEEIVAKNVPKHLRKQYEDTMDTIHALRTDPNAYLKSKAYDRVKSIIEANPELKKSMETFEQARHFIDNPELIGEKLEENLKTYVEDEFKSTELYAQLKAGSDQYNNEMNKVKERSKTIINNLKERLEEIKEDRLRDIQNYQRNITKTAIKNFGKILEERVGLTDEKGEEYVECLLKEYSFSDAAK